MKIDQTVRPLKPADAPAQKKSTPKRIWSNKELSKDPETLQPPGKRNTAYRMLTVVMWCIIISQTFGIALTLIVVREAHENAQDAQIRFRLADLAFLIPLWIIWTIRNVVGKIK